jgi:hypothetical protein
VATDRRLIEFERDDTSEVEGALAALDVGSWMNIEPFVPEDDLAELRARTPSALLRIFSAKGRAIPFGTVVVAPTELSVGLEHAMGAKVEPQLRELGITVPDTWRRQQDHPKRGVVYAVPRDESPAVVLGWILDAATAVAGVQVHGRWTAMIATPG